MNPVFKDKVRLSGLIATLVLVTAGQIFFSRGNKQQALWLFVPGLIVAVLSARGRVPARGSTDKNEQESPVETRQTPTRKIPFWLEVTLVLLIILVGFSFRFYRITEIPPCLFDDESNTAYDAVKVIEGRYPSPFTTGWYEVPTLYSYINSISFRIFGINVFAARATGLAFATLTIAAMYFFSRYVFGVPLGLLATALFAASRYHITMSRWGASEIAPSFYMLLSFGFLLRAIKVREGMTPEVKQGMGFWKTPGALCNASASMVSLAVLSYLISTVTLDYRNPELLVRLSTYHARIQSWQGFRFMAFGFSLVSLALFVRAFCARKFLPEKPKLRDVFQWDGWLFILSGLFLGLCIYTYLASRLVALVVCVYMIALALLRFRLFRRHFWGLFLLGLVFCIVFSPLAYHYGKHWLVFTHRWHDINIFKFCEDAGNMGPFWENLQRHVLMFNWRSNEVIRHGMPGKPLLNAITGVLFAMGAAFALRRIRHPFYFFVHLWFWVTLMGGILSYRGDHESPCSYPVLTCCPAIYVFVLIAILEFWDGLVVFFSGSALVWFRKIFWSVVVLLSALASVLDLYVYFGIQAKDPRMWAHYNPVEHEAAVRIKQYTQDHYVFLNPHYFTFSTVKLLNHPYHNVEKFLGVEALPFAIPEDRPIAMIMAYEDTWLEPLLRKFYPNVRMVPYTDPVTSGIGFTEYFIPKQDIENGRGLIATYTLDDDQGVTQRTRETHLDITLSEANLTFLTGRETATFSALWEGLIQIPRLGEYSFELETGSATQGVSIEMSVAGSTVFRQGTGLPVTLLQGRQPIRITASGLTAGTHVKLLWKRSDDESFTPVPDQCFFAFPDIYRNGLLGSYYRNSDWSGEPYARRMDIIFSVTEQLGSPYGVRWTGKIQAFASGTYTFGTKSDDDSYLYINGEMIVDNGGEHGSQLRQGTVLLNEGWHNIEVLYCNRGGGQSFEIFWIPPGAARSPIPVERLLP